MIKRSLSFEYTELDNAENLSPEHRSLLSQAVSALSNAYAPYSRFRVGAALIDADGNIFIGTNMENASYPLCICAEGAVLAAYNSSGSGAPVQAVAITARASGHELSYPVAPCGACRQMLSELEIRQGQPIRLILQGSTGPVCIIEKISDILPLRFTGSDL